MDSAEMSRGPTEGASELDLEAWRQRALDRVLPAVAVVSLPAVVGGVWLSLAVGPWWIAPFDIVAWLVLAALAAGRGSYRLRASFVIGLVLVVGTVLIGALGPSGIGQIWLPPAPILGGLFFGRKGLLAWLLAVELAILGLSLAVPIGTLVAPLTTTATAWWVMAGAAAGFVLWAQNQLQQPRSRLAFDTRLLGGWCKALLGRVPKQSVGDHDRLAFRSELPASGQEQIPSTIAIKVDPADPTAVGFDHRNEPQSLPVLVAKIDSCLLRDA